MKVFLIALYNGSRTYRKGIPWGRENRKKKQKTEGFRLMGNLPI